MAWEFNSVVGTCKTCMRCGGQNSGSKEVKFCEESKEVYRSCDDDTVCFTTRIILSKPGKEYL